MVAELKQGAPFAVEGASIVFDGQTVATLAEDVAPAELSEAPAAFAA